MMEEFRNNPPKEVSGISVMESEDYLTSNRTFLMEKRFEKIDLPVTDLLIFKLEDDSRIAIRPSGTEPKIKFYISVNESLEANEGWYTKEPKLDLKIESIIKGIGL